MMRAEKKQGKKQVYTPPRLEKHGTIAEVTKQNMPPSLCDMLGNTWMGAS